MFRVYNVDVSELKLLFHLGGERTEPGSVEEEKGSMSSSGTFSAEMRLFYIFLL